MGRRPLKPLDGLAQPWRRSANVQSAGTRAAPSAVFSTVARKNGATPAVQATCGPAIVASQPEAECEDRDVAQHHGHGHSGE